MKSNSKLLLLCSSFCLLFACGPEDTPKSSDAGSDATVVTDTGADDQDMGGAADMGAHDASMPTPDFGPGDAGTSDLGVDAGAADGGMDAGAPDMDSPCDRTGLPTVEQTAVFDVPNDQFLYSAFTASPRGNDTYAFLSFEIYPYLGGTVGPQTYDFPGVNYANCNTCLLMFDECMRGSSCARSFLVKSGQVVVSAADTVDGSVFQATFNDVVLKEVTVDPNTYESTEVPDGETWCLDNFPANTVIDVMMN